MKDEYVYILLEVTAKNYFLVNSMEKIGFTIDDAVFKMLETKYGSVDGILINHFNTDEWSMFTFLSNYVESLNTFEDIDGIQMYNEAMEHFKVDF